MSNRPAPLGTTRYRRADQCPEQNRYHTPAPSNYMAWHSWAAEMAKTHDVKQCRVCGFFACWLPKEPVDVP